jgi:hypothetical protein
MGWRSSHCQNERVALEKDDFQRRAKASLAVYKQQVLGVAEYGIWRKNSLPYPHILPIDEQKLNVLPPCERNSGNGLVVAESSCTLTFTI